MRRIFFWWGYRWLPRAGGAGKRYKSIYGQLRWNMWEYELIRYRLMGGGRPAASYYFVTGRPRAPALLQVIGPGSTSGDLSSPLSQYMIPHHQHRHGQHLQQKFEFTHRPKQRPSTASAIYLASESYPSLCPARLGVRTQHPSNSPAPASDYPRPC